MDPDQHKNNQRVFHPDTLDLLRRGVIGIGLFLIILACLSIGRPLY